MTIHDKAELIIKDIKLEKGTNPIQILRKLHRKNMLVCMVLNIIY